MYIYKFYKQIFGLIVALMCAMPMVYAQQAKMVTVSGTITSADDKEPLIGVSIVAGEMQGVTSDIDGAYTISVAGGTVLTFSYLGFQEVKWTVP
ncbi:MAG: carboxypeptidase-like regulatory domain-containing protein, partial [Alistipes sp.]|nr:carboxypeptidase-like regulatory domain-containing protein [Alistipes sp.]